MNIHEYQAKGILKKFEVTIQEGIAVDTSQDAISAARELTRTTGTKWWVIKAQIHAGGRGKGGGVKLAKSLEEVEFIADEMLGMQLVTPQTDSKGKKVHKLLVAQDVYYPGKTKIEEFYIGVLLDRITGRNIIMYSLEGGVDIESIAKKTPHLIFKEEIDSGVGYLQIFQARNIAFNLGLSSRSFKEMITFTRNLFKAYDSIDASLFEINPVLKTSDDRIIAVDAKVNLDDNALFRHPDLAAMRDTNEEDPTEVEASKSNLSYVKLDGNVGCMVNGAGLAMATMDIIKLSGGSPANFLDVGGAASAETVETGFRIILKDPNVKAILINVFGGIVRCDRVARGIVQAYKNIDSIKIPIIIRLQGTNSSEASEVIRESGLKVESVLLLEDAAQKVKKILSV